MSDDLDDQVGFEYLIGGKRYRLSKAGVGSNCYFCGAPPPVRFLYWSLLLRLDGTVGPTSYYPQCEACQDRPRHVLEAIIANGGKMPD